MRNKDYTYYHYSAGTSDNARTAIKNTVRELSQKLKNSSLLANLSIYLATDKDALPDKKSILITATKNSKRGLTQGVTLDRFANYGKKEIVIFSEKNVWSTITALWEPEISSQELKNNLLHEIGHQFDFEYGNKNQNLKKQVSKFVNKEEWNSSEETIYGKFEKQRDLSDSEEFKQAWKKDVEIMNKKDFSKLGEFSPEYSNEKDINFDDGLSKEEIEYADVARNEEFAQLFAYAMGADDDKKNLITTCYKNCYKVIQKYINKFLISN